jgi:hypothetical protein
MLLFNGPNGPAVVRIVRSPKTRTFSAHFLNDGSTLVIATDSDAAVIASLRSLAQKAVALCGSPFTVVDISEIP